MPAILIDAGPLTALLSPDDEWHERASLRELMARYRNVPMSLADATLVRLSELLRECRVFTLDTDFLIYRRHGNRTIPVLMPEA